MVGYARHMSKRVYRVPVIFGTCRFESHLFSNVWHLTQGDRELAGLRRMPSRHVSMLVLPDGSTFELRPNGWGTVVVESEHAEEVARIERRSWWGRSWEISGTGFACLLVSDPWPRRWSLRFGSEPVARLRGTPWSYNRLTVDSHVAIPVTSLALAWHVLARPWEAAAAPGALVPARPEAYRLMGDHG